ncbi:MAG: hypothetical protein WB947_04545 [Thermoplasmata archaeon]
MPVTHPPVLIIAPQSPALEAIAREVIAGAAEAVYTSPLLSPLTGSEVNLVSVVAAPLVFLGWRADNADSCQRAHQSLSEVERLTPDPRYIAKFEASIGGGASADPPDEMVAEASHFRPLGPIEPFAITAAPHGEEAVPCELERARRWGAEMYTEWLSALGQPGRPNGRVEQSSSPRMLSWCGAME